VGGCFFGPEKFLACGDVGIFFVGVKILGPVFRIFAFFSSSRGSSKASSAFLFLEGETRRDLVEEKEGEEEREGLVGEREVGEEKEGEEESLGLGEEEGKEGEREGEKEGLLFLWK
jgi:hypothetical protein